MIIALPMTTLIISYYERFIIAGDVIENLTSEPETGDNPTLPENVEDEQDQEIY